MTNPQGRFGIHGGQYIPETLMNAVIELEEAYNHYKKDPQFQKELTELLNDYAGRPSRLYYAEKMTRDLGGAKIYLKREDLNHTGAHKINNVLGQALLAKKMFDVMVDDEHLMGETDDVKLLKDCSMTANFLNAVFCLYGNKYDEAIGFADLVLGRRECIEAMFIKARAYYAIGDYDRAYDMNNLIIGATKNQEDRKSIDNKLYLFEAKLNDKIGNSNIAICKKLIKNCPECLKAFILLRKNLVKENLSLEIAEDEVNVELVAAFNNQDINEDDFLKMLEESDLKSKDFLKLQRKASKFNVK